VAALLAVLFSSRGVHEFPNKGALRLAIFFTILIIGSVYLDLEFMVLRGLMGKHLVFIYMWWVTASSILARLLLRESPHDVSFRWGGWPGTRAVLGSHRAPPGRWIRHLRYQLGHPTRTFFPVGIPPVVMGIPIAGPPAARFFKFLLISLTIGALWSCKSAAGEEIGWRVYMLTRLIDSGFPKPIFISGFIIAALVHLREAHLMQPGFASLCGREEAQLPLGQIVESTVSHRRGFI
jgi:uncharacterized membrane protein YphA (DoxX/SURF4 family)